MLAEMTRTFGHSSPRCRWLALAAMSTVLLSLAPPGAQATKLLRAQSGTATTTSSAWTTYGGDESRTSLQTSDAPRRPLRIAWTSTTQDGAIYGEPLIDAGRVFIATENDSVEALNETTGRRIWTRSLGTAVPAGTLPCGDIGPTVGVTSTMVIDPATQRLFVSAETLQRGRVHHVLIALSLASGATSFRRDLDVRGWISKAQLQRGALGLDAGRVLVAFGGNYGDCGTYLGYVMAVPESDRGPTLVYRVPSTTQAAIWGAAGMAVATSGDVYVATGNSASRSAFDMGNAVIELSSALKLKSWFAPTSWASDNAQDLDLGSTAPLLLPGGRVFEIGKQAVGYLLSANRLGGIGGQLSSIAACNALGAVASWDAYVFIPCPDSGMVAVRVVGMSLHTVWHSSSATGSPTVGGGVVWSVSNGQLVGLSPTTGHVIESLGAPTTEHFAAPAIADGLLVVAGASEVVAYRAA